MRNRTGISLSAVLIVVLTAAAVVNSGAKPLTLRDRALRLRSSQGFGVSGQFTGVLAGTIRMGLDTYQLSSDAMIYEVGTGPLPPGTMLADRTVFLMGSRPGRVDMVIVRPDTGPEPTDLENHVHVLSNDAPQ